jgi:hypothetical protein
MASTFSSLKFELIGTGEQDGTWGDTTNTNIGTAIEQAITGSGDVTFASADVTLTLSNTNASQAARNLRLVCVGTSGGARQLVVPSIEKQYIVQNDLADTVTIRTSAGTGVAIPTGKTTVVFSNGTDVVDATTYLSSLSAGSISLTSALGVASGGTGRTSLTANNVVLGNGASQVQFVAPGTTGNVLTSDGTTWTSAIPSGFPAGTRMTFNQTAAPTGWTKDTSRNNTAFRLVSGNVSSGGSIDFTVAFSATQTVNITSATASVGATTLSTPQIPSHDHSVTSNTFCGCGLQNVAANYQYRSAAAAGGNPSTFWNVIPNGGGGSHTHPFSFSSAVGTVDLSVKYVDLIIAQKD